MQKGSIMPIVILLGLTLAGVGTYVWYVYTPTIFNTSVLPKKQRATEEFSYWQKKADMPTARTDVSAAVLDGKIYVVGGVSGVARTLPTVEVYDPTTDSWSTAPDMPQGLHHTAVVAYQGKLYVIGGYQGIGNVAKNNVYVYDPKLNSWEEGEPLPEERGAHGAAVLGNHMYVVGGVTSDGLTGDLLRFDFETEKWTELPRMPTARDNMAVAATDNQLLVAGGRENTVRKNLSVLEIFTLLPVPTPTVNPGVPSSLTEPPVGEWSKGPAMSVARGGVAGAKLGQAIVVSGGEKFLGTFNRVEAYDVRTGKWHDFPDLTYSRQGAASVVVEDTLYVIGGGRHSGLSVSNINEALEVKAR